MADMHQTVKATDMKAANWALDIVREAIAEADAEFQNPEVAMSKRAFEVSIDPGSIIGALTGYYVAKQSADKQFKASMNRVTTQARQPRLSGDYYTQMENLLNNLRVLFTPIGVVYTINGIGLETLETGQMTPEMKRHWAARDTAFFTNLMINRMESDLHLAEQLFAQRLLERHQALKSQKEKLAGINADEAELLIKTAMAESDEHHVMPLDEIINGIQELRILVKKASNSPVLEKYCDLLFRGAVNEPVGAIGSQVWRRDDSIEKAANFIGTPFRFLNLGKGEYLSPQQIKNKVQVAFLPDRVLFVYDNMIIGQIHISQMNEDGYLHFRKRDANYFAKFLSKELATGHTMMRMGPPAQDITKKAAAEVDEYEPEPINIHAQDFKRLAQELDHEDDPEPKESLAEFWGEPTEVVEKTAESLTTEQELWVKTDIHPFVYYMVLNKKYGDSWLVWDPAVLIKTVEEDYKTPLGDIALNKMLFLQLINSNHTPIENYHVFEKMVRAFNGLDIDFYEREAGMSLAQIVNAMMIVAEDSPIKNPYNAASGDVVEYIAEALASGGYRVVCPPKLSAVDEKAFWDEINNNLHTLWVGIGADGEGEEVRNEVSRQLMTLRKVATKVVETFRSKDEVPAENKVAEVVHALLAKLNVSDEALASRIIEAVIQSLAVDFYMKKLKQQIKDQILTYLK